MNIGQIYRGLKRRTFAVSNAVTSYFQEGKRVALVSCDAWRGRLTDDLLLQKALIKRGARADIISWQDPKVDYSHYDAMMITSMWGYQNELEEFEKWLKKIETSKVKIFNKPAIIRENYDKTKQLEIMKRNKLPHIKTEVITLKKLEKCHDFPFVVKPAISASGQGTFLVRREEELERAVRALGKSFPEQAILKQEYHPEISKGELSIVLIKGEIMNAVKRFPGILEKRENRVVPVPISSLSEELVELCKRVGELEEFKGHLYLRVDVLKSESSHLIMEIEAFEPQLFYYLLKGEERRRMLEKIAISILEVA